MAHAKTRKRAVNGALRLSYCGLLKLNQMNPSQSCCAENKNGILAKIFWFLWCFALNVAMPIPPMIAAAEKLAVAEKHISTKDNGLWFQSLMIYEII